LTAFQGLTGDLVNAAPKTRSRRHRRDRPAALATERDVRRDRVDRSMNPDRRLGASFRGWARGDH